MRNFKPIVLHTGRSVSKEERRRREEAENIYKLERLKLVPPEELSERAKTIFENIVNEAFWLDNLDVFFVAGFAHAYDRWLEVVEKMNGTDDVIITENAKGEAVAKQNPYRYALRSYANIMQEFSARLGLSAIDRLKLTAPVTEQKQKEENPFEEFMSAVE